MSAVATTTEQSFMERAQQEIAERDERIRKLEIERDLATAQAQWNAETIDKQREKMRDLESLVALLQMEHVDE